MGHLFAYGSLMCADIMREVSGLDLSRADGIVRGYRRRAVRDAQYPGLVPEEDSHVEGVVYRGVPPSAWDRLDRFEGEMYVRQHVEITLNDGTLAQADAYVVRPEFLDRLEDSDWDFQEFLRSGKARFQASYQGYQVLD